MNAFIGATGFGAGPVDVVALVPVLREAGEARRDRGMTLAAERRRVAVAAGQAALLWALLESADGTGTIDSATNLVELATKFGDGGKWRGTVCRGLAASGIVEAVGVVKSDRPARHRGYITRWRLRDRDAAERELGRLLDWLATAAKENPPTADTVAGDADSITTPNRKESSDATV